MEKFPPLKQPVRLPLKIPIRPYLQDHRIEGRAVYPAVESMQTLAGVVARYRPAVDRACLTRMNRVRFDKFLDVPPEAAAIPVLVEISTLNPANLSVGLLTRTRLKNTAISRVKNHATLSFSDSSLEKRALPLDLAASIQGVCHPIAAQLIYRELVPFGPAYRNLKENLIISADGVLAKIVPPEIKFSGPLGSPFTLDAAFHAACVWGQRYAGRVAYPVALERRVVVSPTRPGQSYFARIVPAQTSPGRVIFDIWIHDRRGRLCEMAGGVQMRDVSRGRLQPPGWISADKTAPLAERLAARCRALSIIELESITPLALRALSRDELGRLETMGKGRRPSYLAARMALKRVSRALSGNDLTVEASAISTVYKDRSHPRCPLTNGHEPYRCSVAHDSRFAVAVASERPVGVDVEVVSDRLLKLRHLFMSETEQGLPGTSKLSAAGVAARIWSVKEAVAKALDLNLAEAWARTEVISVAAPESRFKINGREMALATHETVDDHLFTLVSGF